MSKKSLIQKAIFLSKNPPERKPNLTQWSDTDLNTLVSLQDKYKGMSNLKDSDLSEEDRNTLQRLIKSYVRP